MAIAASISTPSPACFYVAVFRGCGRGRGCTPRPCAARPRCARACVCPNHNCTTGVSGSRDCF
eukprot:11193714-Lingulodinium_polyedra.AAC.1